MQLFTKKIRLLYANWETFYTEGFRVKNQKKEPYDSKQLKALAILHDDIDNYINQFYTQWEEYILHTITPQLEEIEEGKKKIRSIFGLPKKDMYRIEEDMDTFLLRMNAITNNQNVRSVSNKLFHVYSNGLYVRYSTKVSHRKEWISMTSITERLIRMEHKKNHPDTDEVEKEKLLKLIEHYDYIYEHMNQREQKLIAYFYRSDEIRFSIYNQEEYPLQQNIFFLGGLVVPDICQVTPPSVRKKRKDSMSEDQKYYIAAHKFFLLE